MKFRKKPVEISARKAEKVEYIETLEGRMCADKGDWIITGVNGEEYPCKPDIFEKTYEPVDQEACAEFYVHCKDCRFYDSRASLCKRQEGGYLKSGDNCFCPRGERE